jgi:hypothetical protein
VFKTLHAQTSFKTGIGAPNAEDDVTANFIGSLASLQKKYYTNYGRQRYLPHGLFF